MWWSSFARLLHVFKVATNLFSMLPAYQRMPQDYFPYYNNVIQTHFPCKSLSYPLCSHSHYHAHGVFICFKLLPHPPYFHTHCCNKPNMANLPLILSDVGILNAHASSNLVLALGARGRGWGIGWGDSESEGG